MLTLSVKASPGKHTGRLGLAGTHSGLACLGCRAAAAHWGGLNNRNAFPRCPGGWRHRIRVPAGPGLPAAPLPGSWVASSPTSSHSRLSMYVHVLCSNLFFLGHQSYQIDPSLVCLFRGPAQLPPQPHPEVGSSTQAEWEAQVSPQELLSVMLAWSSASPSPSDVPAGSDSKESPLGAVTSAPESWAWGPLLTLSSWVLMHGFKIILCFALRLQCKEAL